jgi:hypothetical protein
MKTDKGKKKKKKKKNVKQRRFNPTCRIWNGQKKGDIIKIFYKFN